MVVTSERIAIEGRLQGITYAGIAKMLGVSRQYVQQLVQAPLEIREQVIAQADGRCKSCEKPTENGHIHHIKCVGLTAEQYNSPDNLSYLCIACHRRIHRKPRLPKRQRMMVVCLKCGYCWSPILATDPGSIICHRCHSRKWRPAQKSERRTCETVHAMSDSKSSNAGEFRSSTALA